MLPLNSFIARIKDDGGQARGSFIARLLRDARIEENRRAVVTDMEEGDGRVCD